MPKTKLTPGTALTALLKKYNLNYNRLAKTIGLSSAMVRLIARDENPVSASVAFRLAKFFKMKPEFWLSLQMDYDKEKIEADKDLAKALKDIPTVDKATFERKPKTVKSDKEKAAKKTAAKPKTAKSKKTAKPKAAASKKAAAKPAKKSGRPAQKGKPAKAAKAPAKKAVTKRSPAPKAKNEPAVAGTQPTVSPSSESTINEPQI
ncbi:MAG: HigA family addiction module antitoxin [Treponema sp.]|nr:HigA family addiction module antitoxin [Treponema sp.]